MLHPRFGDKRRKDLDENGEIIRKPPKKRNRKKPIQPNVVVVPAVVVKPTPVIPKVQRSAPRNAVPKEVMKFRRPFVQRPPVRVPALPTFVPTSLDAKVETTEHFVDRLITGLEDVIRTEGADTIAAFVPVSGLFIPSGCDPKRPPPINDRRGVRSGIN